MREIIVETIENLSPIILSIIGTFLITKYKYNKNIPLDKLEIAYNRVYYPVYRIIRENEDNKDIDYIIEKIKPYFQKMNKYIDSPTIYSYESLCECKYKSKKKSLYKSFQANIKDRNLYLRKRLGYLDSNFGRAYKYAAPDLKLGFAMLIEFSILYSSVCISTLFEKGSDMYEAISKIGGSSLLALMCQALYLIVKNVYYAIRK